MTTIGWLKDRLKRRLGVPTIELALADLCSNGFSPAIVFDVGAHHGDFARLCHRLFEHKPMVYCFEPLDECAPFLADLERKGLAKYLAALVGDTDAESVPFYEMGSVSSVFDEHTPAGSKVVTKKTVSKLDTLIERGTCRAPDFLKIDAQGSELHVLKGIERNLPQVQVILAELNFLDVYAGVPLAHQVIHWLGDRGFLPYDIASLIRRPLDRALWQADFLFVQADGPFRSDKRWSLR
ncbi:MAG TPA: FkbM family methyltransferase [Pirellulales bacterium]|nr:FkbM family methyltransferase [Pirellulales bacterium]